MKRHAKKLDGNPLCGAVGRLRVFLAEKGQRVGSKRCQMMRRKQALAARQDAKR